MVKQNGTYSPIVIYQVSPNYLIHDEKMLLDSITIAAHMLKSVKKKAFSFSQ